MASYGITDASQIIDYDSIKRGCTKLKAATTYFRNAGNDCLEASEDCTKEVLSVDNLTMQPALEELGNKVKETESKITEYANQIEELALQIYNSQKEELAAYLKAQEEINKNKEE